MFPAKCWKGEQKPACRLEIAEPYSHNLDVCPRRHRVLKPLLVAVLLALSPSAASADNLVSRDYARCRDTEADRDRYICYIRLGLEDDIIEGTIRRALHNEPELAAEIGISLEPPAASTRQRDARPSDAVLIQPSLDAFAATNEALELDQAGVLPDEALRSLLEANADVRSGSYFLGQITTPSPEELRITQYQRILTLHQSHNEEPELPRPSRSLVLAALRNWGRDLAGPIRTYSEFDQDESLEELAAAYANLGELDVARSILERADIEPARIDLELALITGDLGFAWEETKRLLTSTPPDTESTTLNSIDRLAYEAGDAAVLTAIRESYHDPEFTDLIYQTTLFYSIGYLGEDVIPDVLASLERRGGGPFDRGTRTARLMIEVGREAEVDAQIDRLAIDVQSCESRNNCQSFRDLMSFLAIRGRSDEIEMLIGEERTTTFFDVTPYEPFEIEVRTGQGEPASMELMIDRMTSRSQYWSLMTALQNCVRQRSSTRQGSAYRLSAAADFDGAYACATRLIEVSEMRETRQYYQRRYESEMEHMRRGYRFSSEIAASTVLALAQQMFKTGDTRAITLEREGIRLLADEGPERPPHSLVFLALERLGVSDL